MGWRRKTGKSIEQLSQKDQSGDDVSKIILGNDGNLEDEQDADQLVRSVVEIFAKRAGGAGSGDDPVNPVQDQMKQAEQNEIKVILQEEIHCPQPGKERKDCHDISADPAAKKKSA